MFETFLWGIFPINLLRKALEELFPVNEIEKNSTKIMIQTMNQVAWEIRSIVKV